MPAIDTLLNLVPDSASTVLSHLRAHPDLASQGDSHGYTLLHAAASYEQFDLAVALVREFRAVDANCVDEDGETALFYAESERMAAELLELGVDPAVRNFDGLTAEEKLGDDDEQPLVARFLRGRAAGAGAGATTSSTTTADGSASDRTGDENVNGEATAEEADPAHPRPPPLPPGVKINLGTMMPDDIGEAPDPEFRRRIEELASREDFDGEATQRELRDLISDAVSGLQGEAGSQVPSATRRRVE